MEHYVINAWRVVTHIWTGSSLVQGMACLQATAWKDIASLLIVPLGSSFNEVKIKMKYISHSNALWKVSAKW